MRTTSIETYEKIKLNGLLSKRRLEVYETLYIHGPMTANELIRYKWQQNPDANQTGWNARFSELERMGVIAQVGIRQDSISGNSCVLWDTTDRLPGKLIHENRKTKKQILLDKIAELGMAINDQWKVKLREIYILTKNI